MKILIICLTYSQGFSYMENQLAKAFIGQGHTVRIVSSTESYVEGKLVSFEPGNYYYDGLELIRLEFAWSGNYIARQLWKMKGLKSAIEDYRPEIIYHMNIFGIGSCVTSSYCKRNPRVSLFYDSHAAFYNSGKNWISRLLKYKMILGRSASKSAKIATNVFYVGEGEKAFLKKITKIPEGKLALFPLGEFILDEPTYEQYRKEIRKEYQIGDNEYVVCHSGKLDKSKRTSDIISSIIGLNSKNLKLWIVGSLGQDIKDYTLNTIASNRDRIAFLGWRDSTELGKILCACDIYVQFSLSSTFQTALCRKCFGITANPNQTYGYIPEEVFRVVDNKETLEVVLGDLIKDPIVFDSLRNASFEFAKNNLDYDSLVKELIIQKHIDRTAKDLSVS